MCMHFSMCMQILFRHMLRTRFSRSVSAGLFNGLCILLSCGRIVVTADTRIQSIARSDGDNLYSPECQQRPRQLDEPQRQISSEGLINYTAFGTKPQQRPR